MLSVEKTIRIMTTADTRRFKLAVDNKIIVQAMKMEYQGIELSSHGTVEEKVRQYAHKISSTLQETEPWRTIVKKSDSLHLIYNGRNRPRCGLLRGKISTEILACNLMKLRTPDQTALRLQRRIFLYAVTLEAKGSVEIFHREVAPINFQARDVTSHFTFRFV